MKKFQIILDLRLGFQHFSVDKGHFVAEFCPAASVQRPIVCTSLSLSLGCGSQAAGHVVAPGPDGAIEMAIVARTGKNPLHSAGLIDWLALISSAGLKGGFVFNGMMT